MSTRQFFSPKFISFKLVMLHLAHRFATPNLVSRQFEPPMTTTMHIIKTNDSKPILLNYSPLVDNLYFSFFAFKHFQETMMKKYFVNKSLKYWSNWIEFFCYLNRKLDNVPDATCTNFSICINTHNTKFKSIKFYKFEILTSKLEKNLRLCKCGRLLTSKPLLLGLCM